MGFPGKSEYVCSTIWLIDCRLLQNRDIVPCKWCNVRKYNFDMIEKAQGAKFIHFCSLNCFNQHGSSGQASGTSVSSASSGGMPVIQSVASLAPTSTASQVGASPVIPPSSIPSQPIPPPPPQVVKGQYIWPFYCSLTNFKMKTTSMDTLLSFFNI